MIKNIVSVTAAVIGTSALLTACNFEQPTAGCIVQDASFANWAAKYDLKEGQNISAECQEKLTIGQTATINTGGEAWGVFKFKDPDRAETSVLTIRPQGLYSRAALDPCDPDTRQRLLAQNPELQSAFETECALQEGQSPYAQTAVGRLPDEPDAQNFCVTSDWKAGTVNPRPSGQVRPDVAPTDSISYQFSNVRVYAAPDAPGTQIGADLTYVRDECTAQYTVRAIWPAVPCNPDATASADRCGEGSGINPNFKVRCDTTFRVNNTRVPPNTGPFVYPGTCVADGPFPSFN
jgi:hypothetical protein